MCAHAHTHTCTCVHTHATGVPAVLMSWHFENEADGGAESQMKEMHASCVVLFGHNGRGSCTG